MVIFVCGPHNCGKTTVARWLVGHNFLHIETGEIVRREYARSGTSDSFQSWAEKCNKEHPHYFDDLIAWSIRNYYDQKESLQFQDIVVTGNRQKDGIEYIAERCKDFGSKGIIVYLEANPEILFARHSRRMDRRLEENTYEYFVSEYLGFDDKMGLRQIKGIADFIVNAEKSKEHVRADIRKIFIMNGYRFEGNDLSKEIMGKITIPCHWNKQVIEEILSNDAPEGMPVAEVYGALALGGPIGHGRSSEAVVQVSKDAALEYREFIRSKNISFTYLLNAPFNFDKQVDQQKLDQYLHWVLNDLQPDAVTIASHELMRYVRDIDAKIPIHISTIAGIKNAEDLAKYLDVSPSRIVPHHDSGKNFSELRDLVQFGRQNNVETEMLVTESCLRRCPNREAHYAYLAQQSKDKPFHTTCNADKIKNPAEFLLAGGITRPEDTEFFENMGVEYFKISGRSKPAEWLPEVVSAYQRRNYDGNLIRLLGIDRL